MKGKKGWRRSVGASGQKNFKSDSKINRHRGGTERQKGEEKVEAKRL